MKFTLLFLLFTSYLFSANECIVCHKGIEHIRHGSSGMMQAILEVADKAGHKGNDCIVCHGGNPKQKSKKLKIQDKVIFTGWCKPEIVRDNTIVSKSTP